MIGIIGQQVEMVLRTCQCASRGREKFRLIGQSGSGISIVGRLSRYCQGVTELDLEKLCATPEKALEVLQSTCRAVGIDVLVPAGMASSLLLAEIKDQLEGVEVYPSPGVADVRRLSNKLGFAGELNRLNLPQPEFWELTSQSQIEAAPWNYPVVIKPLDLENGIGVRVCKNAEEALEHFATLKSLSEGGVMVQEYVRGSDMDLTLLADHGKVIAWTIYALSPGKWGGKTYRFLENPDYLAAGTRLVEALNYSGILHIDGRFCEQDRSVKMIECNPRMFGSVHSTSYAGVNFVTAGVAAARGTVPAVQPHQINGDLHSLGAGLALFLHGQLHACLASRSSRCQWRSFLLDPLPLFGFWWLKRFGQVGQWQEKHDLAVPVSPAAAKQLSQVSKAAHL
jgi:hypothetical protein